MLRLRTRVQRTPPEELAHKCFNAKNCAPFAYTYAKYASGRVTFSRQVRSGNRDEFGGVVCIRVRKRSTIAITMPKFQLHSPLGKFTQTVAPSQQRVPENDPWGGVGEGYCIVFIQ